MRGVDHDDDGRLVFLCNPGQAWSPVSPAEVIADIQANRHGYYVRFSLLWFFEIDIDVHVVSGPNGPYLRTGPDGLPFNNLDNLPACGDVPAILLTPVRRNIAHVSAAERARLRDAMLWLLDQYAVPDDPVNLWFKQDQVHQATHVHDEASFFPWHRELVNRFEALLQEYDAELALHYWDWTTDPRRTPDAFGNPIDLMTADFMGAASGVIGPPFEGMYNPSLPPGQARDPDQIGSYQPAKPPRRVSRSLPESGRSPKEVRLTDFQGLSNVSDDSDVRVRPDQDVVGDGFAGRRGEQFENLWNALDASHDNAHLYIGGDIRADHTSFRDPLVFLLHSNLDRLWASWQLRRNSDPREVPWRLDGEQCYGDLATGQGKFTHKRWNEKFENVPTDALETMYAKLRQSAVDELSSEMAPWAGRSYRGYPALLPWLRHKEPRTPKDPVVVRPPLYEAYLWDDDLSASWAAMRLGKRLSDGDVIEATIELDAAAAGEVDFVLQTGPQVGSWKGLRVSDGEESESTWLIETDGANRSASVSLWAHQVRNGQALIFHKWKGGFLGIFGAGKRIVYRLGDLSWLPPGCRVTFRWVRD